MPISIQHNPFATRFTRPGEIPFQLREHENLNTIVDTFRDHRFLSQIVGPHGSGKTTLTYTLEPLLREDFSSVRRVTVRDAKRIQSDEVKTPNQLGSRNQLLMIDGFERLPWLHRRLLLKHARYPQTGLLITTHRPIAGVSILYEVQPTLESLQRLARELAPRLAIETELLAKAFETTEGNIRESLMTLYNWFESRQSTGCRPK